MMPNKDLDDVFKLALKIINYGQLGLIIVGFYMVDQLIKFLLV